MWHFLGFIPFCKVFYSMSWSSYSLLSEVDPDFWEDYYWIIVEVNTKENYLLSSFLVLTYYHNSIYVSIVKKKIAGKSAIYFFDSISLINSSSDLFERKSGAER